MSLNITVNGKFSRTCARRSILDDPAVVKRQLECQLRRQRLQEVREESKKLAAKIRTDVAAEQERQLRNLEAIKAQELECWREHVLAQKAQDYRSAIFQVGTAHRAAKIEKEKCAARERAQEERKKKFNKELKARIGQSPKKSKKASLQSVGIQTPKVLMKEPKKKQKKRKRKRKVCPMHRSIECQCTCESSESETEESEEGERMQKVGNKTPVMYSASSSVTEPEEACPCPALCPCTSSTSSTSSSEDEMVDCPCSPKKQTKLSRNPPVLVDIEVGSDDSVTITRGEIKDKHAESNRHYSHVVRGESPQKQKKGEEKENLRKVSPSKPRFTQVSNLIKSRHGSSASAAPAAPPPSLTAASGSGNSPRKSSVSIKSGGVAMTISGGTVTLDATSTGTDARTSASASGGVAGTSGKDDCGCSTGRVQFYDYNNKYTKEYPQPVVVHETAAREQMEPSAMEQANTERQQQTLREQESERRRARSEERGRKALEREQVRRDCIELTQKLESLTQQYPQLLNPTDANLQTNFYHKNKAERLEKKRNTVVEDMMLKPSIITCPEVSRSPRNELPVHCAATVGDLNLGAPPFNEQCNNTASSESCCSILLGYVDDQTNQIRSDLNQFGAGPKENIEKRERLKNLLQRIEDLRRALSDELSKGSDMSLAGDNMQNVIDGVSDVRKERERILIDGGVDVPTNGRESPLEKHMHDVKRKEAVLEQKLRELCKMQKGKEKQSSSSTDNEKECKLMTNGKEPLEIIIKVKGDTGRRIKSVSKAKGKSPRKVSSLIDTSARKLTKKKSITNGKQAPLNRQNSYDSNSTSYRSLPSKLYNQVDAAVNQFAQEVLNQEINAEQEAGRTDGRTQPQSRTPRPHLNPLIAHYIQRLLGMSRSSVKALGMSSSEIETPSSSIMNTPTNISPGIIDPVESQERLERVQQFIDENRSFVNELEESLRSQNNASLESSIQIFEEIWQERLRREKRNRMKQTTAEQRRDTQTQATARKMQSATPQYTNMQQQRELGSQVSQSTYKRMTAEAQKGSKIEASRISDAAAATAGGRRSERPSTELQRGREQPERVVAARRASQSKPPAEARQGAVPRISRRNEQAENGSDAVAVRRGSRDGMPISDITRAKSALQTIDTSKSVIIDASARASREISQSSATSTEPSQLRPNLQPLPHRKHHKLVETEDVAEAQITRYEKLTENCTQRIAELTELIHKVRTEKRRLVEITLSSVSEGRNSTEYIDLPEGQNQPSYSSTEKNLSSSSGGSGGSGTNAQTQPTESVPVKNLQQQTPASSGEVLSATDDVPLEKHKATGISRDSGISLSRPMTSQELEPPSQASTVTHSSSAQRKGRPPPTIQRYSPNLIEDEVAHELSTIIEVDTPGTSRVNTSTVPRDQRLRPVPFPTFEQYALELNLDVTRLDANTTMRMQQEYEELIAGLQAAQGDNVPNYEEFPTLTAYLQNLTANQEGAERCQSPETLDELLDCLRLANLSIKSFPSRNEYMRRLSPNSPGAEMIDTASLENIIDTHTNTETESESINIEEELRRRNLLKKSFHRTKEKERIFSSTANEGAHVRGYSRAFTESGVEQLTSTSDNISGEFEKELLSMGLKWPTTMRQRKKETEARSSTTTPTSPEMLQHRRKSPTGATVQPQRSPAKTMPVVVVEDASNTTLLPDEQGLDADLLLPNAKRSQFSEHLAGTSQKGRVSPTRSANASAPSTPRHEQSPTGDSGPNASADTDAAGPTRSKKHTRSSHHYSMKSEFLSDNGRPMNLRDFLTKELLKHCSTSSSSSTDDSMRSQFLQSIIESMTPRTNAGSNQRERQKTSTPVTNSGPSNTHSSGHTSTSSPTQLFSGESRISSVHFREHSITRYYPPTHDKRTDVTPSPQKDVAEREPRGQ